MKKFLPYFKLLLPVKGKFAIAIVAGVIYGLASGFGLPFMTSKVFPLLFSSNQQGVTIAVKEDSLDGQYHELSTVSEFPFVYPNLKYSVNPGSPPVALPNGAEFTSSGELKVKGEPTHFDALYYEVDSKNLQKIESSLFVKKSDGKFERISSTKVKSDPKLLAFSVLLLPLVFFVRGVAGYFNTYYVTYCGQAVLEQIRTNVFEKFQRLDLAFFQRSGTGDLITRIMTQTMRLQQMLTTTSNDIIKQPISFVGAVGALIYLSIQSKALIFIVICAVIIPLTIIPIRKFSKHMLRKMRQGAVGEGELGNCVQENIVGARDIRSFNLEQKEVKKFTTLQRKFYKHMLGMTKYRAMVAPSVEVITSIGVSAAIYYSARNGMTLEKVVPLVVALYMSYEPLKKIAKLQNQLVLGGVALEMLENIINTEEKITEPKNPKPLPQLKGGITFQNVEFSYDTGPPALKNINTVIKPGEVVALVGPSGAGKSTFTHLISRTYEITKGQLFFDTFNVLEHKLSDLRAQVAVVSQDPYLFNDTVKNNILLGKLDASDAEVWEAAERANCADFIKKLPNGMDTICGEKATLLSGGQRQRLAIARAFLKDAPILILDEATSALDAESEQIVQAALAKLVEGRTTLIIAHRFSSIQIATRILVFNQGEIVAGGNHESLLETSEIYKELYLKQSI